MVSNTATQLIERAKDKGLTICTAESCTGGMVSAALTDVAGSSAVFERGFVTYSNAAKIEMLGVSQDMLDAHGAVSEEVAVEMANGARARAGVDIAVSITGIAGPGGSEFKPEGRVCFALSTKKLTTHHTVEFGALGRAQVRQAATEEAIRLLTQAVESLDS